MKDVVFIRDLQVDTVIGAYDWERSIRQTLVLSVEMSTNIAAGAHTDELSMVAVDYAAVATRIRSHVEASEYLLLETLVSNLAQLLADEFSIAWIRIKVEKPRPNDSFVAGLIYELGAQPST